MKKIGIIGGLGPESTLDYYRGIINAFHLNYDENGYPEIVIESVNLKDAMTWAARDEWDKVIDLLSDCFNKMKYAGAEFGAIASNTPHKVFEEIQAKTELPLISIVTATRQYAQSLDLKNLLLLGTGFTMRSSFYQKELERYGIKIVVPNREHQDYIHEKIFSELERGIVKDSTKMEFLGILHSHKTDGVILACTEFPMIIKQEDVAVPCLDTAHIHINSIVNFCLRD